MVFLVNNGPFAGREGKQLTSRQIRERLDTESLGNVAIEIDGIRTAPMPSRSAAAARCSSAS